MTLRCVIFCLSLRVALQLPMPSHHRGNLVRQRASPNPVEEDEWVSLEEEVMAAISAGDREAVEVLLAPMLERLEKAETASQVVAGKMADLEKERTSFTVGRDAELSRLEAKQTEAGDLRRELEALEETLKERLEKERQFRESAQASFQERDEYLRKAKEDQEAAGRADSELSSLPETTAEDTSAAVEREVARTARLAKDEQRLLRDYEGLANLLKKMKMRQRKRVKAVDADIKSSQERFAEYTDPFIEDEITTLATAQLLAQKDEERRLSAELLAARSETTDQVVRLKGYSKPVVPSEEDIQVEKDAIETKEIYEAQMVEIKKMDEILEDLSEELDDEDAIQNRLKGLGVSEEEILGTTQAALYEASRVETPPSSPPPKEQSSVITAAVLAYEGCRRLVNSKVAVGGGIFTSLCALLFPRTTTRNAPLPDPTLATATGGGGLPPAGGGDWNGGGGGGGGGGGFNSKPPDGFFLGGDIFGGGAKNGPSSPFSASSSRSPSPWMPSAATGGRVSGSRRRRSHARGGPSVAYPRGSAIYDGWGLWLAALQGAPGLLAAASRSVVSPLHRPVPIVDSRMVEAGDSAYMDGLGIRAAVVDSLVPLGSRNVLKRSLLAKTPGDLDAASLTDDVALVRLDPLTYPAANLSFATDFCSTNNLPLSMSRPSHITGVLRDRHSNVSFVVETDDDNTRMLLELRSRLRKANVYFQIDGKRDDRLLDAFDNFLWASRADAAKTTQRSYSAQLRSLRDALASRNVPEQPVLSENARMLFNFPATATNFSSFEHSFWQEQKNSAGASGYGQEDYDSEKSSSVSISRRKKRSLRRQQTAYNTNDLYSHKTAGTGAAA